MNKQEKNQMIDELAEVLTGSGVIYLTDTAGLNAEAASDLRRTCFNNDISLRVVKNTLLKKAMEKVEGKDFTEMFDQLVGPTAIMLSETGNGPAKMIKDLRKKHDKPVIKAAYVEESIYIGDQVDALAAIKSKNELIADVIMLLQSPAKNVISALNAGNKIAGLVKALEERAQ